MKATSCRKPASSKLGYMALIVVCCFIAVQDETAKLLYIKTEYLYLIKNIKIIKVFCAKIGFCASQLLIYISRLKKIFAPKNL